MTRDSEHRYEVLRKVMVEEQLRARGIHDSAVLDSMLSVRRHLFVSADLRSSAYDNRALPIGPGQTISQPYVVALMLETLQLRAADRVLEIGTGSGYQTALLAEIVQSVFSLELDEQLLRRTQELLQLLKYDNVELMCGDGYAGWEAKAPFDKIVVSAAPSEIPRELVRELKVGGRMVLPLGEEEQTLVMLEKREEGLHSEDLGAVQFVEMRRGY